MESYHQYPKIYLYRRIVEAKIFIDKHYFEKINLEQISDQACFSKFHFQRLFKESFGRSPHQYLTELRIQKAKELLSQEVSVKETCLKVGYDSVPSFIHLFKRQTGITPSTFLKRVMAKKDLIAKQPFLFIPNCFAENYGWREKQHSITRNKD